MIMAILAVAVIVLHSLCAFFVGGFWGTAGAWLYFRRRGIRPQFATARLKFYRRWIWPVYVLWIPLQFITQESWIKSAVYTVAYGVGNWLFWRATKDIDDDFWKKLIEKGTGAVERLGNRLVIVVPAPAGA